MRGWGRLGSLVPAGSIGVGAALPLAQSQCRLLLDTWGMRVAEQPGLSDLPLVGATLLARYGEDCCKVHPSAAPGAPRRTGPDWPPALHSGGAAPRARAPLSAECLAGRTNRGPSGAGSSTARPICRSWCRLSPRHVSTAIPLEMGEGNCILSGQQHSRWETDAS